MAETPGIHLSDPSVMAKISSLSDFSLSGQAKGWRHTHQQTVNHESKQPRDGCLWSCPEAQHYHEAHSPCPGTSSLVRVLTHTIVVQAIGAIRKRQVKKHDSISLVGSEGYVSLFPILRQPRAAPVLGKARPCGILDRAPDQLPRDLVSVPASPSSRPVVLNR